MPALKAGELVAARMSGGITIARVVDVDASRVRVAVRRRKEARLPIERIILATQILAADDEQVADFRRQSEDIAADVDIAELWEVLNEDNTAMRFADIAELYWGADAGAAERVALLLCLDRDTLYFEDGKAGYTPRTPSAVEETLARRNRQARQAADADALIACLDSGELPAELTAHQQTLMGSIREFAVFGDEYARSSMVKSLLEKMERKTGGMRRRAFDALVACGVYAPDEPLELVREGIATAFSVDALAAADAISADAPLHEPGRADLTALPTITIDDADTKDRDDALSLETLPDADGGALYRLGVHITDAGALIPQGSPLDAEANLRMSTLYIPDSKIPMLPELVSQDKGSLEAGMRRAAISLIVDINADGEVLGSEVKPSVIVSDAALSYEQADGAIAAAISDAPDGGASDTSDGGASISDAIVSSAIVSDASSADAEPHAAHAYGDMLASLHMLTGALKRQREAAGAVGIDRDEMLINVLSSDEIEVRLVRRTSPARRMVAECMVLCNAMLGAFCRDRDIPAAYRSQTAPDLTDLADGLPPGVEVGEGALRQFLMMRRFEAADTSTTPAPHGGLGVAAYIQATSPLRRYPDMVMQRQITHYLTTGEPLYGVSDIANVASRADVQIRGMGKIENERRTYWLLKFFKLRMERAPDDDAAALFKAIVLDNQPRRTALLELAEYPYRIRARLPESVLPGAEVTLRLHSVDLWEKRGSFIHVPDGDVQGDAAGDGHADAAAG